MIPGNTFHARDTWESSSVSVHIAAWREEGGREGDGERGEKVEGEKEGGRGRGNARVEWEVR